MSIEELLFKHGINIIVPLCEILKDIFDTRELLVIIITYAYITIINKYENSIHLCKPCSECQTRNTPIESTLKSGTYIKPILSELLFACKDPECTCSYCKIMKTPISLEKSGRYITEFNKTSLNIKGPY